MKYGEVLNIDGIRNASDSGSGSYSYRQKFGVSDGGSRFANASNRDRKPERHMECLQGTLTLIQRAHETEIAGSDESSLF